jgi:hypothetical protein
MMYYPFVHPPRPVLWQALLYWDNLTSIAPVDGYQYQFGAELTALEDLGLYRPAHADDLPSQALANLVGDLRRVVEELPGEDLVPVPGPLEAGNRVYWGKLPLTVQEELVGIGALAREDDSMFRVSPVLLSRLMIVLAKHLAGASRGVIPFTDSLPAHQVAFAPLGPDLRLREALAWQMDIGALLPIPARDTPLVDVLKFRLAYPDEREQLAQAVRQLLIAPSGPTREADPVAVQEEIKKAVRQLEKAGDQNGIVWVKRSLLVLGAIGAAAAGTFLLPEANWLLTTLAGLGMGVSTVVARPGVSTEFAYLQQLQCAFPDATWRTGTSMA